jgi:hypothetical protein
LAGLDQARLIELLNKRAECDSELASWIEVELATAMPTPSPQGLGGGRRRTAIHPAPIREKARAPLAAHNWRGRYWDNYRSSGNIEELQRLVEKAVPFLEAGDGAIALRILEPIVETFVQGWPDHAYESDEHLYEFFADLGRLMAETALLSDLAADERDTLAETPANAESAGPSYAPYTPSRPNSNAGPARSQSIISCLLTLTQPSREERDACAAFGWWEGSILLTLRAR